LVSIFRKREIFNIENPKKVLNEIFKFLNLFPYEVKILHKNKGKRSPMKQIWKEKLQNYFEPYNTKLYKLIGKNFNWENK